MIDYARANAALPTARARLFAIPGVHAVGIGRKIVAGEFTDEFAIMAFVEHKQPVAHLAAEHVIPQEIDGVKTDVYESEIPRYHANPGNDTTQYPFLRSGIQIKPGDFVESDPPNAEPGGLGNAGTLGCFIEIDTTIGSQIASQIFAVTNFHVVGKHLYTQPTNLTWDPTDNSPAHTFSPANQPVTPNTPIAVNVQVGSGPEVNAFYTTGGSDTGADVATRLAQILSGLGTTNQFTAPAPAPGSSTLTVTSTVGTPHVTVLGPFGPNRGDNKALTSVTVVQTPVYPPVITITVSGPLYEEQGGAYVTINPGGTLPTYGTFVVVGSSSPAYDIANAINLLQINGVSATPTNPADTGNVVTVTGAHSVECQFTTDRRVGQPDNSFGSWCSHCCSHRIGQVAFARLDLDVALILLDPGIKYEATVQGLGPIVGAYDVTQDLQNKKATPLMLRGRSSITPNHGTLLACNVTGFVVDCPGWARDGGTAPDLSQWRMLIRYYTNAFKVQGNNGARFSWPGDSGAAILTDTTNPSDPTQVAGILFAGGAQSSVGTRIQLILDAVSVWGGQGTTTTLVTDTTGQPLTVPTLPGEDPKYRFPPDDPLALVAHRAIPQSLSTAQSEIAATPGGQRYGALIMQHLGEAQMLVNTNRKMATVWQRNGGPTIVEGLLQMLEIPGQRIPPVINGTPLEDGLQQIAGALARYGSDTMAADVKAHSPALIQLAHLTYPELLAALA